MRSIEVVRAPNGRAARRSISRVLQLLRDYATGGFVFSWLRLSRRPVLKEIVPLSLYLERELFPSLRKRKTTKLCLSPNTKSGSLELATEPGSSEFPAYCARHFVHLLESSRVRRVDLDTHLESGQIVEAVLLLLHTHMALPEASPSEEPYELWSRRRIASALLSSNGYKKFCTQIRFDRDAGILDVAYAYCPLPLSRITQRFTDVSKFADHRALFRLAPWASLLVLLLFTISAACAIWSPVFSLIATATLAVGCALIVGLGVRTVGAIQYDKEQYEALKATHIERITHLSRFPAVNPQLVIELKADGSVAYINPSAQRFLESIGRKPEDTNAILPDNVLELVERSIRTPEHVCDVEFAVGGRVLRYWFSVFPEDMTVIASAADVTQLKNIESQLRLLNEGLEARVRERTEELAQTQDAAILCLAGLAETRDPETGHHLERTRHYVLVLCEHLNGHPKFEKSLTERNIQLAFKSAPLHDIGKVGVPDSVLLKPGKLSAEEFEHIKRHPIYGGDALSIAEKRLGFNSFLSMGKEIAYYHHERWDGKGYPYGIGGDQIPWPARLMAVADVYDALTSKRPYKEPWSHEEARDEIVKNRGTQFDPDVVDAFLAEEDRFVRIAETYAEPEVDTVQAGV